MPKAQKLPSGNWRVRVYDGKDQNGKDRYKSFTAPTKKQAEYLAAEYAATKKIGEQASDDKTLAECYARYIEIKRNTLSPTTVLEYERAAQRRTAGGAAPGGKCLLGDRRSPDPGDPQPV